MRSIKQSRPIRLLHVLEDICVVVPLIIVLVMTLLNVVLRYILKTGILWSEEFIGFCMLFIGVIGAAACVRDRLNTSLDGVVCKLPPLAQKVVYFFVNGAVAVVLAYFTYGGIQFTQTVGAQKTFILNWPMKIFYGLIPIGCFLCLVEQLLNIIDDVRNCQCRFKTIEEQIAEDMAAAELSDGDAERGPYV